MKTIHKIFCVLFLLTAIVACDIDKFKELQDTFKVVLDPDAVLNKKELVLKDAQTSQELSNTNVTYSVEEAYQKSVFTTDGTAIHGYQSDSPLVTFGLLRNIVATTENPTTVAITLSAEGYISKTIDFIFDGTAVVAEYISLIKISNLPSTIDYKKETTAITDGKTEQPIAIESNGTSIDIPVGTDATGPVSVTLINYDTQTTGDDFNAAQEFPDGFTMDNGDYIVPEGAFTLQIEGGISEGTITIPINNVAAKSNNICQSLIYINGFYHEEFQSGSISITTLKIIFGIIDRFNIVFGCPAATTCTLIEGVSFQNTGGATQYKYSISNEGNEITSGKIVVGAGETITVARGETIPNSDPSISLTALLPSGQEQVINLPSTSICTLDGTTIDVTASQLNKEYRQKIDLSIDCDNSKVALNNTMISFSTDNGVTYYPYGKIQAGILSGYFPTIDDNIEYTFRFNYDGPKEGTVLGSEINDGIITQSDINKICDEIN
ncbi:hypothetical protein [Flavicella sp.]|uniref:hypothetical protein n=1 Tax=Flavicella sp. TaxID=2957742 RepID=UPI00301B13AF